MLLGCRDDDELSSAWKPEVLLELEGKCEEEWYIGARRQLGARCECNTLIHTENKRARSHTCYRDDIFSVYALCIYTLSVFHSLSVRQALDMFVALAKHVKENVPTTCKRSHHACSQISLCACVKPFLMSDCVCVQCVICCLPALHAHECKQLAACRGIMRFATLAGHYRCLA